MPRSVDSSVSAERRALEQAAVARARAEAELLRLRIQRRHRAHMAVMAEQHARELDAARVQQAQRSHRDRRWAGALSALWLAGLGFASLHAAADVPTATGRAFGGQIDTCGWSVAAAEQRASLEPRIDHDGAVASMPEPSMSEAVPPPPGPQAASTWRAVRVAAPAPRAVPRPTHCDDASGDPCCAFGQIVC